MTFTRDQLFAPLVAAVRSGQPIEIDPALDQLIRIVCPTVEVDSAGWPVVVLSRGNGADVLAQLYTGPGGTGNYLLIVRDSARARRTTPAGQK